MKTTTWKAAISFLTAVCASASAPCAPSGATGKGDRSPPPLKEWVRDSDLIVIGKFKPDPTGAGMRLQIGKIQIGKQQLQEAITTAGEEIGAGSIEIEEVILGPAPTEGAHPLPMGIWPRDLLHSKEKGIFFLKRSGRLGASFAGLGHRDQVLQLVETRKRSEKLAQGERNVRVRAGSRTFPGYIPASASREHPVPLLVLLHGNGGTAEMSIHHHRRFASASGTALLALEGKERLGPGYSWVNDPDRGAVAADAIRAMLKENPDVDPKRIVWNGFSAGCWPCCEDGAPLAGDLCHGVIVTGGLARMLPPSKPGQLPPRLFMFAGTEDDLFHHKGVPCDRDSRRLDEFRCTLKNASAAVNIIEGLPHQDPPDLHLLAAIHWVLEGEGPSEENRLPAVLPLLQSRGTRQILVEYAGAEGAGASVTRTKEEARREAQRLAELVRGEKDMARRAELAAHRSDEKDARRTRGALSEPGDPDGLKRLAEAARRPLVCWAGWTAPPGEVRVVRSPAGFHVVWAER